MIFKTKNHYKKQIKNLEFQKLHLQIILQDTIEENDHLKEEIEHLKTIEHETKQL